MAERESIRRSRGPGYETRDVALRPVIAVASGLAALVVLFSAAMWGLQARLAAREARLGASERPSAAEQRRTEPPEPRLQPAPRLDLLELHRWEDRILSSYAWVDPKAGVVRIPIDRAIELFVERHAEGSDAGTPR